MKEIRVIKSGHIWEAEHLEDGQAGCLHRRVVRRAPHTAPAVHDFNSR